MKRTVRAVGWIGLLGTAVGIVAITWVLLTYQRDEAAYVEYVETYGRYRGYGAVLGPARERTVIEAGDRACNWLAQQPMALLRNDRRFDIGELQSAYGRQLSAADKALPSSFLAGAWAYLCPGTTELVRPHTPFQDTTGD